RWYGADRETTRHSDGFDGETADGRSVLGCSRNLLRLGGDGFLTLHWERMGGRPGRLHVWLAHGDLMLMDRGISGTKLNGLQRQRAFRVTHRAGGVLAPHSPALPGEVRSARSFVTLVWTTEEPREDFLALIK
ncbi:unnamed protein product, partial [Polarella glacialis]